MAEAGLRLEAREVKDLTECWWVLTDSAGTFIADHQVRLDATCWQYEAFTDLLGYLSWHVTPDHRAQDEARVVSELGAWIGTQVFGPVAAAMASAAPATVRVVLPADAAWLAFRPLELAYAGGKPLAVQDVTLVMDTGTSAGRKAPTGDRLRVLGLFSLPEGGQPLNLRRERYELVKLIERIAAGGKAADVRVLQYGVTRERLRGVLEEAEGWDIIHISGHGAPGELLLETAAGQPDGVTAAELAGLLDLAKERVALVTVSACWSAALTAAEQRRLLGLPVPHQAHGPERARGSRPTETDPGTLANALADRLNCAVLAMRYPVDDDFAIALSGKLYELLAAKGQPLPRAVGITLKQLAESSTSALSVATPALFSAQAVDLKLAAPKRTGPRSFATGDLKMAGFPPQPDRFVGRVGVMARASAALAAQSGLPGVLLHGMPGGGKTACALELAYGHEHAFEQLIWYKAPDDGMAIDGALTEFTLALERYLDGFQMAHLLTSADSLAGFLPRLTELMERFRLLLVIDNAESLLTESGAWRDDQWGQVLTSLTAHAGLGRVIVTSRRLPSSLARIQANGASAGTPALPTGAIGAPSADVLRLQVEAVDALSADEALLLARELPHLRALIYDELPGIDRELSRRLALGVLTIAQGHPKLLELADGQAAHPEQLVALVEAGDQAWREQGGLPAGFFATEEATPVARGTAATAADYWHVLAAWTKSVMDTLPPGERDLFWFLCCLEEPDRERFAAETIWPHAWDALGRDGQAPDIDQAVAAITARGLASTMTGADDSVSYAMHPGVAEAGRAHVGKPFRDAVDAEAAMFWAAMHRNASGKAGDGTVDTGLLIRAGLAAIPYLVRRQEWKMADSLLYNAFIRDQSRMNAATVLPVIRQIAEHRPQAAVTLGLVLEQIDPAAAEVQFRACLEIPDSSRDYSNIRDLATRRLMYLCLNSGRLPEALTLIDHGADYTRQAGHGPWSQLFDNVQRLQVLNAMGHTSLVFDEAQRLRRHMDTLPASPSPNEVVFPWVVRDTLLRTAVHAAVRLSRWDDAIAINAVRLTSMRDRRAPAVTIARARFNDYAPLLRLGRTEEALQVLLACRQAFQDAHDTEMLGKALSALADTEDERGHGDAALRLEHDALRYKYLAGEVGSITVSYHNLGDYLRDHARQASAALASHLAAALIYTLTSADGSDDSIQETANDLRVFGTAAVPPSDVADLCRQVGDIPGTDLPGLLASLSPDPQAADRTLGDLVRQAQELAAA